MLTKHVTLNLLLISIILVALFTRLCSPAVETFEHAFQVAILLPSFKPTQNVLRDDHIVLNQTGNRLTNSNTEFLIFNDKLSVDELKEIATSILPHNDKIKFVVHS